MTKPTDLQLAQALLGSPFIDGDLAQKGDNRMKRYLVDITIEILAPNEDEAETLAGQAADSMDSPDVTVIGIDAPNEYRE